MKHQKISYIYKIAGEVINYKPYIKDLGLLLDDKLYFHHQIDSMINQSKKQFGLIKFITFYSTIPAALLSLYITLIRSKLEYGSLIWNNINTTYANKIEKLQTKIDSYIKEKYNMQLSLKKLELRRAHLDAIFIQKILTNHISCPNLLNNLGLKTPYLKLRQTTTKSASI